MAPCSSVETQTVTDNGSFVICTADPTGQASVLAKAPLSLTEAKARLIHTRALRGKYKDVLSSSCSCVAQKAAEKLLQ